MTRATAWFAITGLFLAGIAIGVLGTLLTIDVAPPHWFSRVDRPSGPGRPGPPRPGADGPPDAMHLERLSSQLGLSAAQRARIEQILDGVHDESESLRAELAPRLETLMERTDEQIRGELDDTQREQFDRLRERHRGMMERFFVGGPGARGRGPGRRPPRPDGRRRPAPPPGGGR